MPRRGRPKLAVWKFASCDGCQLSLLDCEDDLLQLARLVDIAHFTEASRAVRKGPYDVSLVEGSITTPHEARRIHEVRRVSRTLVAIGACATAGGIQALRNFHSVAEYISLIYASPKYIDTLDKSTPISDHVRVDCELRGCPVDKRQLLDVLVALVNGRKLVLPNDAVCMDCKRLGHVCVSVAGGAPCLGPVTHTGCGALCPGWARGCYGCFGPKSLPNTTALATFWVDHGIRRHDIVRLFRGYNASAEPFRREGERHDT